MRLHNEDENTVNNLTLPLSKKSSSGQAGEKIPVLTQLANKEGKAIDSGPGSLTNRRMQQEEESELSD